MANGQMKPILVLGGGPAGCAAASLLKRWGHDVVVRTKKASSGPRLIESIPPSTRKLFDTIGLRAAIDSAAFLRSTGNTVSWGAADARVERFGEGELGWQVTRAGFAAQLLAHLSTAGVRVEDARVDPTPVGGIRPAFTLDCTGRAGVVARARRLRLHEGSRTVALTGIWQAVERFDVPDPTHTLIESYEGGWAWSVPESARTRVVAVMVNPTTSGLVRGAGAREIYLHELQKTSHVAALMDRALLVDGPAGWDASMYHARRYVDGDALLVGDAASFIDPVSSVGIKKALASGWLAAVAVHTSVQRPDMREIALEFFAAREAEVYTSLKAITDRVFADAASGHAHPFWGDRSEADAPLQSGTSQIAARDAVSAAFERLRGADVLSVGPGPDVRIEPRPAVSGIEIVLEPRLTRKDEPQGIRYAYDVDLIGLFELAPMYTSVPDAFAAYNRRNAPVSLPDFLGALSTALAQKWLVWV